MEYNIEAQPKKKSPIGKIFLYFFLFILFFIGGAYLGSAYLCDFDWGFNTATQQTTEKVVELTQEGPQKVSMKLNKIFYEEENNIFSYDILTKEISKITEVDDENTFLTSIKVIDDKNIGFVSLIEEENEERYTYTISTLNLETKDIATKLEITNETISTIGFSSTDKFVYEVNNKLLLFNNGENKVIDTVPKIQGRGLEFYDEHGIEFADCGNYFFYISTSAPVDATKNYNYDLRVYNLEEDDSKTILENATHSKWLDNENIVYVDTQTSTLNTYNINNEEITIINLEAEENFGRLSVLDGVLVYAMSKNQIGIYNFETTENIEIIGDIEEEIVDIFWICKDVVLYILLEQDEFGMGSTATAHLYNLTDNVQTDLIEIEKPLTIAR